MRLVKLQQLGLALMVARSCALLNREVHVVGAVEGEAASAIRSNTMAKLFPQGADVSMHSISNEPEINVPQGANLPVPVPVPLDAMNGLPSLSEAGTNTDGTAAESNRKSTVPENSKSSGQVLEEVVEAGNDIEGGTPKDLKSKRFQFLKRWEVDGSVGFDNLVDPKAQHSNPYQLHFFISGLGFLIVLIIRKDPKMKIMMDRFLGWLKRKLSEFVPALLKKLSSLQAFSRSLPRAKFSDMQDSVKSRDVSKSKDSVLLELKKMSIQGEYHPKLKGTPNGFRSIVSESCMRSMTKHLPPRLACKDWSLLFSAEVHGYNIMTLYQLASNAGPFLLVVMDMNRYVFGAFCSESLRMGDQTFYGTGESFIFQLHPQFRVHNWSGKNEQILVSTKDMIAVGGGGKLALYLDSSLDHGLSEEGSSTFEKYDSLASEENFRCCAVEIWGFTMPSTNSPKRTHRGRKALSFV